MVIGIDLGTTYSAVSYLDEKGDPQIILNRDGDATTPSVVFVDDKEVTVGKHARKKALQWPKKICRCVKRFMGFRENVLKEKEVSYSPEAIAAFIVKRLIEDVLIQRNEKINGIVVTVPTYFTDSKRIATIQAVNSALQAIEQNSQEMGDKIKDVDFIEIIDEPKAAAIYYCHKSKTKQGKVLIYDLGGGTFDTALVDINGNTIKIVAEAEEHAAGGHYFDNKVLEYVISYMDETYGMDLKEEKYSSERELILMEIENCKKMLSKEEIDEVKIPVCCKNTIYDVVLTREKFNQIIEPIVLRTKEAVCFMLEEKGYELEEVDEVVLVGGSSKIPFVRNCLKDIFEKELCEAIDPEMAVTYGASVYANMLLMEKNVENDKEKEESQKSEVMKLEDVCTHSIGLLTIDPNTGGKINTILIDENTPIVAEIEKLYEIAHQHQTYIKLELTEAEEIICEKPIKLPKPLEQGTEVMIRVVVNSSHLIEVHLRIPSIDFYKKYEIPRLQNLSEEEQMELSGLVASKNLH